MINKNFQVYHQTLEDKYRINHYGLGSWLKNKNIKICILCVEQKHYQYDEIKTYNYYLFNKGKCHIVSKYQELEKYIND